MTRNYHRSILGSGCKSWLHQSEVWRLRQLCCDVCHIYLYLGIDASGVTMETGCRNMWGQDVCWARAWGWPRSPVLCCWMTCTYTQCIRLHATHSKPLIVFFLWSLIYDMACSFGFAFMFYWIYPGNGSSHESQQVINFSCFSEQQIATYYIWHKTQDEYSRDMKRHPSCSMCQHTGPEGWNEDSGRQTMDT